MRISRRVWIILGISLLAKLFIWYVYLLPNPDAIMTSDSVGYHKSAIAWIETGRFVFSLDFADLPQTLRTPGYPAFLVGAYRLLSSAPIWAIPFQIIASVGTIALAYYLGRQLWGKSEGLWIAAFFALDLVSFASTLFLLTETLFAFFTTLTAVFGVLFFKDSQTQAKQLLFLSAALGLATLVRPISYYFILPMALLVIVHGVIVKASLQQYARWLIYLAVPFVLLVGGWQLRNYQLTGSSNLSQISGINMLFFRAAAVIQLRDGVSLDEARTYLGGGDFGMLRDTAVKQPHLGLADDWNRQGLEVIATYPLLYLQVMVRGGATMMVFPSDGSLARLMQASPYDTGPLGDLVRLSPSDYIQRWVIGSPLAFILFAFSIVHLAGLYLGVGSWLYHRSWHSYMPHLFVWGLILYLIAISAGPEAYDRFRVPIMPLMSLYAAVGLQQLAQRFSWPNIFRRAASE